MGYPCGPQCSLPTGLIGKFTLDVVADAALVDHAEAVYAAGLAAIDRVQLVDLLEVVQAPHRTVHESLGRSGAQHTTPAGLRGPGFRCVLVCAHEILHKRQVHFQSLD